MIRHIIEYWGRGLLLGAIFVLNIFFANNANAYQVNGGSFLKIIQSGENTGSNSFVVEAHLKPIAHRDYSSIDEPIISPVIAPVTTNTSTGPVVAIAPSSGGGEKYDASGWILERKYNELVLARDEQLKTSAPKRGVELVPPTDLDDIELINDNVLLEKSENTIIPSQVVEDFKNSPKVATDKINFIVEEKETNITKKEEGIPSAEFHNVSDIKLKDSTSDDLLELEENTSEKFFESEIDKSLVENQSIKPILNIKELDSSYCLTSYQFYQPNPWEPLAYLLFSVFIGFFIIILLLILLLLWMIHQTYKEKKNIVVRKKPRGISFKSFLSLFIFIGLFGGQGFAITTTPQKIIYEGQLLDTAGNPVSGNYDFRFSLWDNQDYELTDNLSGSINPVAADFFGWQEVQSQNIVNRGKFTFQIGTVTPFTAGLFDRVDMSLQIEVKPSGTPDTSYELIDLDTTNPVIDRMVIDSVPYAFNADKLDFHETGFDAGEIPYLDLSGKFTNTLIPDIDAVLLDGRDTGYNPGDIPYIDTTTGLLPTSILPSGSGGTSANIPGTNANGFIIDLDDTGLATDNLTLQFGSTLNETIMWNGLNSQFEISDDLNIAGNLTVSGTINGASVGIRTKDDRLSPRYPNSILEGDGTNNDDGYMYEEEESILGDVKNSLRWMSTNSSIQDYDIIIRYPIAENFKSFKTPSLSLEYQTTSTAVDSKIDILVEKEGVVGDQLSGSGIGLSSNAWINQDFNLTGGATWAVGDVMIIRLKMYSKNSNNAKVGDIVIHSLVD